MFLPIAWNRKKVQTTDSLLKAMEVDGLSDNVIEIDLLAHMRIDTTNMYEKTEQDIPVLIQKVLVEESTTWTKFVRRTYCEEDAWLVRINAREYEVLEADGQELCSDAYRFVKIHTPKIFVKTLALPMIEQNH